MFTMQSLQLIQENHGIIKRNPVKNMQMVTVVFKKERQIKIEYENNILVKKVFEIERRPLTRESFPPRVSLYFFSTTFLSTTGPSPYLSQ